MQIKPGNKPVQECTSGFVLHHICIVANIEKRYILNQQTSILQIITFPKALMFEVCSIPLDPPVKCFPDQMKPQCRASPD